MTEYIQVVTTVDRAEEAAAVIAPLAQNFEHSPRLTIGDARQPPGNGTPRRWPGPISWRPNGRALAAMKATIQ
jgi:hypothetical protein